MVLTCSQFLFIPPPFINKDPLLAEKAKLHVDVTEVPLQGRWGWKVHNDLVPLEGDVDLFGNVDLLVPENGLLSRSR